jgi:hypothetical protein
MLSNLASFASTDTAADDLLVRAINALESFAIFNACTEVQYWMGNDYTLLYR